MIAEILTVGDELLIGQVVNTNASWIGEQLSLLGVDVRRVVTLGDEEAEIRQALADAYREAEFVLVTGGLGPTHDDLTREAVAAYFDVPLHFDDALFERVKARFVRRGYSIPDSNRKQALVPEGFEVLPNPRGTAPGLWQADGAGRLLAVLPGVPHEMRHLLEHEVAPRLRLHKGLRVIRHRTLLTTGIGESNLQDALGDLSGWLSPDRRLAYLPGTSGVRLRMTVAGQDAGEVDERLDAFEALLRERAGRFIFGTNDDTLEGVVGALLRDSEKTVALAESCTGGHVLDRLTNVPGASSYVIGGIIAYCNSVKIDHLGVDEIELEASGAVSEAVAVQMARGIRDRFGADIGVSTTGIAGPGGGTPDKPVGTVWVGYADAEGARARLFRFADDRLLNKARTGTAVLGMLLSACRAETPQEV